MNHTTNYNLPQWEDTDAVRREDMNAAMSAIDAAMAGFGNCRMEVINYTGDGTYGEDHEMTFTFQKQPSLFVVFGYNALTFGGHSALTTLFVRSDETDAINVFNLSTTWSGVTVRFHSSRSPQNQMNQLGVRYRVIAIYPQ